MSLEDANTLVRVNHTKEMPPEVAAHLGRIIKPLVEEIGSTVAAGKRWGISQSHVSQIQNGRGCGIPVLLTLRRKLRMSLEELCFPPDLRLGSRPLDLDAVRAALREELEADRKKGTTDDRPTVRRR